MKIAIGSDHAGYELKSLLIERLTGDHEFIDVGTGNTESVDYPPFCAAVARAVVNGEAERGIVIGGSGQGEAMAANKVRGARAALCDDILLARLSREHNDANVISLGARIVAPEYALEILDVFLKTPFEGGRHEPRLKAITQIEDEEAGR